MAFIDPIHFELRQENSICFQNNHHISLQFDRYISTCFVHNQHENKNISSNKCPTPVPKLRYTSLTLNIKTFSKSLKISLERDNINKILPS